MNTLFLVFLLLPLPAFAEHDDAAFDLTQIPPSYESTLLALRDTPPILSSRIISRAQWGADESFLFVGETLTRSRRERTIDRGEPSEHVKECAVLQNNFPDEFKTARVVTHDAQGRKYRWSLSYSNQIHLLVVHHTALEVNSDTRTEEERIRALYTYHADSLGWGDVGYNYLIGESGRIYEGRAGGDHVTAGHAYCHNVGSIGIALLGDFGKEKPTQQQIQNLQWLLDHLAKKYDINLSGRVQFHGKNLPAIVGHNDLNSTACPGYYLDGVLAQVRSHVLAGTLDAGVVFPTIRTVKNLTKRVMTRRFGREGVQEIMRDTVRYSRRTQRSRRLVARAVESATRGKTNSLPQTIQKAISSPAIRILLSSPHNTKNAYHGTVESQIINGRLVFINTLPLEQYLYGLAEEPDTEPYEKQKAFAIAARSYAAHYMDPANRKFPGMPYDGSNDPAEFQAYGGLQFEKANPNWVRAVKETEGLVLTKDDKIVKAAYFSSDEGRTLSPDERGWSDFPFAKIFHSKPDPWCLGLLLHGHGVGMSGCGAGGQAREGKSAEEILKYYYPGTTLKKMYIET